MPDPDIRQTGSRPAPISNPVRDLKNVRRNFTATAGEVREFMGRLKGKSPREMLGVVASSSLVQSIITATVITAILLAALTILPYGYAKLFGPAEVVAEESEDAGETAPAPASESPAPPTDPEDSGGTTPTAPPDEAIDALGIGEEKPAPPGTNPLEGAVDNLFDEVK